MNIGDLISDFFVLCVLVGIIVAIAKSDDGIVF